MKKLDCIFLAAGFGKRMKRDIPKQLIRVGGKPIMIYPLEILVKSDLFNKIIITYPDPFSKEFKEVISKYFINNENFIYVKGGETRQESVFNAVQYVKTERVIIHEAARPFIDLDLIKRVLSENEDCVTPVIDIIFEVAAGRDYMKKRFKRDELKNIQLPQSFNTAILKKSHELAKKDGLFFTDDSTLVYNYGHKVRFVEGEETNIKITTPTDFITAERIFFARGLPSE